MAVRDVLCIEGNSSLTVGGGDQAAPILAKGSAAASAQKNRPMFQQGAVFGQRIMCGAIRRQAASNAIIPAAVLLIGMW